jgi:hypothetical protein
MKIEEIYNADWYALFAPDGSFQALTLCPDFATCVATIRLLHKAKLSKSIHELGLKGYKVLPIKLTVTQNG